ncbi:unnamed protein product [Macrosiphum euphorbiae]|uniref:MULE transposase domain-containing protein n=1 Tax=Macrosiphum euphorbiae TaxID=13131 RepID=A0AAV0VJS2_9HEMI|nr:unnamed protein product [Macrosiphum euphorbiae]
MEKIQSKRDREMLVNDGYMYIFDTFSADKQKKFWRCRQKNNCLARIHTSIDNLTILKKSENLHTHGSDAAKVETQIAITNIKKRALSTMEQTSCVINECTSSLSQAAKGVLPNNDALKKQIRRKRIVAQFAPPAPLDLISLEIPEMYQTYSPEEGIHEQFLLADSGKEINRILIFGRQTGLNILESSKTWFVDGTFSVSPSLFSQVYIILAEDVGGIHPIIYALLPNKKGETYRKLFTMLIDLNPRLLPDSISIDFEIAAISAIKEAFPQVNVHGCYYHLTKNFRKKMGDIGMISNYNNDANFSVMVKMIISLAFVPIEDLDVATDLLADDLPDDIVPLLEWFEEYYIGRKNRRKVGRRSPQFPPEIWNLYQRVLTNQNRTNKAANRRLNIQMGVTNPTIWSFINCLKKIQTGRDVFYEQLVTGGSPPKKKKKYIDNDKRILKLVSNYDKNRILLFLRGIANNVSLG